MTQTFEPRRTLSEDSKRSISEGMKRKWAERRGEPLPQIVEQPSLEEVQVRLQHTFANRLYRTERMHEVLDKMYDEIMTSPNTPARLVEVFLQGCDGIAKEMGDRQQRSQVEVSGSIDVVAVQEELLTKLEAVTAIDAVVEEPTSTQ